MCRTGLQRVIIALAGCISLSINAQAVDIPTGAPPSPTFNAQPFSQPVMLFEEFGTNALGAGGCTSCTPVPVPANCTSSPEGSKIDAFLAQPLLAAPARVSNTSSPNPWASVVGTCLGHALATSAAEGRPSGEFFAHQRWDEFGPKVWFQSATAGGRINTGLRDSVQMHHWATGEFAPGGLYHHGATNAGTDVRFHPNFPLQKPNSVWTFDGTVPPKLLMARVGQPVLFRHYNMLPVDETANNGFGMHTLTTHEHNGHNPAESDGVASAWFFPGQYYDYRWAMTLAGYDSINTQASDDRAGYPDGNGGIVRIRGDYRELASTHWFHDHMLDYTAQNVYKGDAAMLNIYSSVDRGREGFKCNYSDAANPNLCFPSGTNLDWGNRDYDVNLVLGDKAWDAKGQLYFNIFNLNGFLGDQMLVNWTWKPYLNVRARRYRFRILNGSVSRDLGLVIVDDTGKRVPFHLIALDGNIMQHAVPFPNAEMTDLPSMAIANRFDIIVDFAGFEGRTLYLVNVMEHQDGRGPKGRIALQDVLSGRYSGDPAVGKFMAFNVVAYAGTDQSMRPADYEPGKKAMVPLRPITTQELASARHHTFEYGRSGGTDGAPWSVKTDGGQGLTADMHRVSTSETKGTLEIWHFKNGGNGWSHPIHPHFEEAVVLSRGGKPPQLWEKYARKDMFSVGPLPEQTDSIDIAIRFREFAGTYVEHCHNSQHEDHAMLRRWDVINPGQSVFIPTPRQTWEGTFYEDSFALK
jgi:FtsP/CotA-like multicopper oxidase with cupredoxin domain